MDLTEFADEFEVFNQPSSPNNLPDEMGIQRKPQKSLQELLESQPGRGEPRKSAQPRLPPPSPRSPPCTPQPTLPSRTEQVDPKRRREQKGNDIMETGRPRPTSEEKAHRAAKQQKVIHAPSRGVERMDSWFPEPQAWLLTPMLGGEPLIDDASIRDFNGGIGCHVASALEQTLLLPKDMVELRGFRRSEVFLHTKRFLGMVCANSLLLFFFFLKLITTRHMHLYFLFGMVLIPFFRFKAIQNTFKFEEMTNSCYQ